MRKLTAIVVLTLLFLQGKGQDFHLSQYDALTQFVNPALTGVKFGHHDGAYRVNADYRSQWRSVASKPYSTFTLGYGMRTKSKWAVGAYLINDHAGAGNLNTFKFLASGSYNVSMDDRHFLSAGLQAGIFQRSISYDKFSFEDQYSVPGGGFDRNISNNENFTSGNMLRFDANFGLYYEMRDRQSTVNPFIGAALYHLTRPNESFIHTPGDRLPFRYVVHGGLNYQPKKELKIVPNFLIMYQKHATEINAGFLLYYSLDNLSKNEVIGGVSMRLSDAVILHAGYKYGPTTVRLSYDINTSSLSTYTRGRGGYEFSVVYTAPGTGARFEQSLHHSSHHNFHKHKSSRYKRARHRR